MFIERAEIPVKEGMEADFAAAMAARGTAILGSAPGCSKVTVGRGVENPGKFILLLEWDSVESHTALTKTDEFKEFGALVGPFFGGSPNMEHFEVI
jgi:heme-degrading monooxygenase HmoA